MSRPETPHGQTSKEHAQVDIVLKRAEVDEGMVELVGLLNEDPDVYTVYSCQGEGEGRPYVVLYILSPEALNRLLAAVDIYDPHFVKGRVSLTVSSHWGIPRYLLQLRKENIEGLVCTMKREGWPRAGGL